MVWSTIGAHIITLLPPCCLLLATSTSELDQIHPCSCPSFEIRPSLFTNYSIPFQPFQISECWSKVIVSLKLVWIYVHLEDACSWLRILNLVLFSTDFFIVRWSLQSSFDIFKSDIPSLNNFVIFSSSTIIKFSPLPVFQHTLQTKRKKPNSFY